MLAGNRRLNHLIVMVDYNKQQCSGPLEEINDIKDIDSKFMDFGFAVLEVNGHDVVQIDNAIRHAKQQTCQPVAIILDTIKGKGCQYAEQAENCHNISPSPEQTMAAVQVLEEKLQKLEGIRGRIHEH